MTGSVPLTAEADAELPLFEWMRARDIGSPTRESLRGVTRPAALVPSRRPAAGEQYRFHVDMRKCIGCKCCVVACNEQNGNPAEINWRRVGEVDGGWYPNAVRAYLSMGCNHCLEPTCLAGCPVDAYTKDPATGIVRHSADACIGCQYCTWNCSYGVPQYNAQRGVVGKCDMCHGRLSRGQSPACVNACPEGALQIEIVNADAWRDSVRLARDSGLPSGDQSLSATRVTIPPQLPPNARPVGVTHVAPEHPHWPLVIMTVLTQLSVGAFATIWLLELLGDPRLGGAAMASLIIGSIALAASTCHLGRPVYAYRALRMWRRSWLSREVLLFSMFSAIAALYAGLLWLHRPGSAIVGALTAVVGLAGITASACIYRVPSRPAWNTRYTLLQFNVTALVLGPLFARTAGIGNPAWLAVASSSAAGLLFVLIAVRFFRLIAADAPELRGTARLLSTVFASRLVARCVLLAMGAVVLPLAGDARPLSGLALALAVGSEIAGRYLFFVSVVPMHMATPYVSTHSEAA